MDARIQALPFDPDAPRGLSARLPTSHHQNKARDLCGGIDGWHAAGRPLVARLNTQGAG